VARQISVLQVHLRKNHSKRGGEYIVATSDKLKVPINLIAPLDLMMTVTQLSPFRMLKKSSRSVCG